MCSIGITLAASIEPVWNTRALVSKAMVLCSLFFVAKIVYRSEQLARKFPCYVQRLSSSFLFRMIDFNFFFGCKHWEYLGLDAEFSTFKILRQSFMFYRLQQWIPKYLKCLLLHAQILLRRIQVTDSTPSIFIVIKMVLETWDTFNCMAIRVIAVISSSCNSCSTSQMSWFWFCYCFDCVLSFDCFTPVSVEQYIPVFIHDRSGTLCFSSSGI